METNLNIDRLRSYANILANSTINGIVRNNDYSYIKAKIRKYDTNYLFESRCTYQEYLSHLFGVLRQNYRYEYVYKNLIVNNILLKKYSLSTTSVLNEFRINKSIADLVFINGTSKVFEIKTELDNPKRLATQIADYKKVFKEVIIVTHHTLLHKYLQILPSDIGIIILTDNFSLNTVRYPIENKNFDNLTILKCLRKKEFSNIILSYYGNLPVTTDFKFYNACKSLFSDIPSDVLHNLMIGELKKRSIKEKEIIASELVPEELKHICLCLDFNQNEYKILNSFLQKKLKP